jgi:hypothetical protein
MEEGGGGDVATYPGTAFCNLDRMRVHSVPLAQTLLMTIRTNPTVGMGGDNSITVQTASSSWDQPYDLGLGAGVGFSGQRHNYQKENCSFRVLT